MSSSVKNVNSSHLVAARAVGAVMVQVLLAPKAGCGQRRGNISTVVKDNGQTVAELTRHALELVAGGDWLYRICSSTADGPESGVRAVCINYGDGLSTLVRLSEEVCEPSERRVVQVGLSVTPETESEIDHSNQPILDPSMTTWDVVSLQLDLLRTARLKFWLRWDDDVSFPFGECHSETQDAQARGAEREIQLSTIVDGTGKQMVYLRYLNGTPAS